MIDDDILGPMLDQVTRLVERELIPAEAEAEAAGDIPERLVKQMAALGLFGLALPAEHGGLGLSKEAEVRVLFEFCRAAPAYRSLIGTTNGVGGKSIALDGTEAQKRKYLPRAAAGECIISFCLTEPEAGSDAAHLKTRAERTNTGWRLNGWKRFISNAPDAGLFVVMARSNPDDPGAGGVSAFLVEAGTPGLAVDPPLQKMGQRTAHTADVTFTDCDIPADALLGDMEGVGFKTAMKALDDARIHMAAVATGLSRRLIDEALEYARNRRQFSKPIADFQLIQAMLADSEAEYLASRAMVVDAARAMDAGRKVAKEAAAAKYFTTEALGRIADRAVQVHGGYGYMAEYPVERLYRDARLFRIFEGTSQIMQLVIAREMLRG
ncbi:MAG: acyl-CoA dehydrogenase family protein [Alphaproteobacteria bacterium]